MPLSGQTLKQGMQGNEIKLLHVYLQQLGYSIPQKETNSALYGKGTAEAVAAFQTKSGLQPTGEVDAPTAKALNSSVVFIIKGKVASRSRAGVVGLRVEILDKNVGEDVPLAKALTDDSGNYQASFTGDGFLQQGKTLLDLQARVVSGEVLLGASEVRYNASTDETLNILLSDDKSATLPAEYESLTGDLTKHYKGRFGELQEANGRQDITYLANKTGWDARAVALAALADQFSARTQAKQGAEIESAFFYALFRAGLPANQNALYQTDAKTAAALWKQGIAQGVIPAALGERIPQATENFQRLAAEHALDQPALAGLSSLKELLTMSLGDDAGLHSKFAELQTNHGTDLPKFWERVRREFGGQMEQRLKLDGQLAYLTHNNAPLMRKLHDQVGQDGLSNTASLAASGYYRAEKWRSLIGDDAVPPEISGDTDKAKRYHYADLLAAQVRFSYPTAVVAAMVQSGETPLAEGMASKVHAFLNEQQGAFEIGMQPVEQYIARNNLTIEPEVIKEVTRIQRVYQITPTDDAMNTLLKKGIDSAYAVVRYDRDEFVQTFKDEIGSEVNALLTYAKAEQVHNTVLNIAAAYLTSRTAPSIGSNPHALVVNPSPVAPVVDAAPSPVRGLTTTRDIASRASDVIAQPTLEALFGEMDYCACEHCRSILSPAAYLVDLLMFCDRPEAGSGNPQQVLLRRRPDIEHLPLTCENTNTPVPYIDLVNETLEYFITNDLSLENYLGYSTDSNTKPEELLASPQFVRATAYTTIAGAYFPPPLPFHQPLENLRRYFDKFETPLPQVMEALRKNEDLDRKEDPDPAKASPYGWHDILMEELRLSRAEYRILTNYNPTSLPLHTPKLTLNELYGFPTGTSEDDVLTELAKAKLFTRRVGITYEDIVEILKTRFINPHSTLLPKLERLGVTFSTLAALKDRPETGQAWLALLPQPLPDASHYGDDIEQWVRNANFDNIMSLIVLTNPTNEEDLCSFDHLEFRYTSPDTTANALRASDFIRLIRFIRLWKKLGWTIEQTDKAMTALSPYKPAGATEEEKLDNSFLTLLPRLGVIKRVMDALKVNPNKDLLSLLACFAPIDTHGATSLYRQMFLSPALLKQAPAFADKKGYGEFLTDTTQPLTAHAEALRAAFALTGDEFEQITAAPRFEANAALSLDNITQVFRRGWLARKLKLSVREFLLLTKFTGIDPFAPEPPSPPILRLIELVTRLRDASLKPVQALYLIWNQDINDKSTPSDSETSQFARTLRAGFAAVESEFTLADDPDGQIARARMALVYGNEATDLFFGLLNNTFVTEVQPYSQGEMTVRTVVPYEHSQATLEQAILDVVGREFLIQYDHSNKRLSFTGVLTPGMCKALKAVRGVTRQFQEAIDNLYAENQKILKANLPQAILQVAPGRIAYDDFRKCLSFTSVLTEATREALKNVDVNGAPVSQNFKDAVDKLYEENQKVIAPFFARYSELQPLYNTYVTSNEPQEKKRSDLLAHFLPGLKRRRKDQQALQAISAVTKTDIGFASVVLDDAAVLHAAGDNARSALDNLTAMETAGLSAQFFFRDTATGEADRTSNTEADLAYSATGNNKLPANPEAGDPISGLWSGYLEAPENGFYKLSIEADAGATATLIFENAKGSYARRIVFKAAGGTETWTLDGQRVGETENGNTWSSDAPIELHAGTLYGISLKVEKVKDALVVRWQTTGRGWEVIPPRYLYSATLTAHLRAVYIRFLKTTSLAMALKLTANEVAHFATQTEYEIGGQGWLNSLPVTGSPENATSTALLTAFTALLDFVRIKAELAPDDERLLTVLKDPAAVTENTKSVLFGLTQWDPDSLNKLLVRFGKHIDGQPDQADRITLKDLDTFLRVHRAYSLVKKLGIPAEALIKSTTNEPDAVALRDFQAALRARYNESDWLNVLRPINDAMRGLQRDALVAYILHQMRSKPDTAHIDTADKLFEYFLMDVQMDPCMQTSRIRHALSSVQLFIERCLMNLETRVAPSAINAKQWEWMKRYRVWEANRKVFLYPENWLEPELRDDQSPFFKETMSELLQGDITEDRAATALLNYLSKLEEVAKLEPCGICYEENDPSKLEDDVAHVVARTAGANRKYFYRRREGGSWTPWERIQLDIEDNPVIPVVWKSRLFLFWLKILSQGVGNTSPSSDKPVVEMHPSDSMQEGATDVIRQAILCWSEYCSGKWQPTKTSDVARPVTLRQGPLHTFDRSKVRLSVIEEGAALRIHIDDQVRSSFLLYNTHSQPLPVSGEPHAGLLVLLSGPYRYFDTLGTTFSITYGSGTLSAALGDASRSSRPPQSILQVKDGMQYRVVEPHHSLQNPWDAPFFYGDSRHVFYVTTAERLVPVLNWESFDVGRIPNNAYQRIPTLVMKEDPQLVVSDRALDALANPDFGVVDPSPIEQFVSTDIYIHKGIGATGTVDYGETTIGPAGGLSEIKHQ